MLSDGSQQLQELMELLEHKRELGECLEKTIKTHKSVKSPISHKAKHSKYMKKREYTFGHSNEKELFIKENIDKYETHSNFSLKIHERDIKNNREDLLSMKSLKLAGRDKNEKEKEDKEERAMCDTISSKSFKSHISSNINFNFPEYISEEPSLEYEEEDEKDNCSRSEINDDDDEEDEKISQMYEIRKKVDIAIFLKTAQIAPILDRFGRLLVDLSPHIAMLGTNLVPVNPAFVSCLSVLTQDGSNLDAQSHQYSKSNQNAQQRHNENGIYNFNNNHTLDPNRQLDTNISFTETNDNIDESGVRVNALIQNHQNNYHNALSSNGRTIGFQVPVMLNPGELLAAAPRDDNLNQNPPNNGNVHQHLNAQVNNNSNNQRGNRDINFRHPNQFTENQRIHRMNRLNNQLNNHNQRNSNDGNFSNGNRDNSRGLNSGTQNNLQEIRVEDQQQENQQRDTNSISIDGVQSDGKDGNGQNDCNYRNTADDQNVQQQGQLQLSPQYSNNPRFSYGHSNFHRSIDKSPKEENSHSYKHQQQQVKDCEKFSKKSKNSVNTTKKPEFDSNKNLDNIIEEKNNNKLSSNFNKSNLTVKVARDHVSSKIKVNNNKFTNSQTDIKNQLDTKKVPKTPNITSNLSDGRINRIPSMEYDDASQNSFAISEGIKKNDSFSMKFSDNIIEKTKCRFYGNSQNSQDALEPMRDSNKGSSSSKNNNNLSSKSNNNSHSTNNKGEDRPANKIISNPEVDKDKQKVSFDNNNAEDCDDEQDMASNKGISPDENISNN